MLSPSASLRTDSAKHLWLVFVGVEEKQSEILRFAQNDNGGLRFYSFHTCSGGLSESYLPRSIGFSEPMSSLRLGVNVDHVATLRQSRYATMPESKNAEPDPIIAARMCERAGAQGIVAHLRSDRRHIQDRDIERLRENILTKLNLEMGNTPEIVDVALRVLPDEVCLVPEKREEVTTEGGLDVVTNRKTLEPTIKRLHTSGIRVSLFIDPTLEQVDAAAELGVEMVELHTGKLANAFTEKIQKEEVEQLRAAARAASESHLQVNAGHGINYKNIALINQIPCLTELNIGHSIVSRAVWVGLDTAVKEMLAAMAKYQG